MPCNIGVSKMPGAIVLTPNAGARQLARNRQRHRDDAAFRCAVGGLPDLPLERSNRSRVDDDAALAAGIRRVAGHCVGGEPQRIESADQVDVDDARETLQLMRAVFADDALARRNTRAIDEPVQCAEFAHGGVDRLLHLCLVRHVDRHELRMDTERRGEFFAGIAIQIGDDDLAAGSNEMARGRSAEAGRAAGNQKDAILDLHAKETSAGCRQTAGTTSYALS